jgi:hypothetical protein
MSLVTPPVDPDHDHRAPDTAATKDRLPPPTTVPCPSARITRRDLGPAAGAVFTVAGVVGAHDAAILSRCLHCALADRSGAGPGTASSVFVVDLTDVESYGSELVDLLVVAEERARSQAIGLHVLELGHSGLREEWEARHSR